MSVATVDFPSTWLAEQVGGKAVDLQRIAAAEAASTDADFLAYIPGLDPEVDAAAAKLPEDRVIDLTEDINPLASPRDANVTDPYVWFNPVNVGSMAQTLGHALADASPTPYEASQYYGLRALATQETALGVDETFQERFDACRNGDLVVEAPVLTYLAQAYAFEQIPLILWDPRKKPAGAVYFTADADVAARKAAAKANVPAVPIDTLVDRAPHDNLLLGLTHLGRQIAAHQDCPRVAPTSTDRPG